MDSFDVCCIDSGSKYLCSSFVCITWMVLYLFCRLTFYLSLMCLSILSSIRLMLCGIFGDLSCNLVFPMIVTWSLKQSAPGLVFFSPNKLLPNRFDANIWSFWSRTLSPAHCNVHNCREMCLSLVFNKLLQPKILFYRLDYYFHLYSIYQSHHYIFQRLHLH